MYVGVPSPRMSHSWFSVSRWASFASAKSFRRRRTSVALGPTVGTWRGWLAGDRVMLQTRAGAPATDTLIRWYATHQHSVVRSAILRTCGVWPTQVETFMPE